MLAWQLHRPIAEIEAMTWAEFWEWIAFFELQNERMRKA